MATIFRELTYALRLIRRNKGFSFAVLLSTALGVGATASIFSLIDAFMLRPLPVPATSRVVHLTSVTQSSPVGRFSWAEVDDIRRGAQSFAGLSASQNAAFGLALTRDEQPRVAIGLLVNGEFFSALGVTPALGRVFTAADDEAPGRSPVAVLSYGTWQREFAGRSDIVGRTLRLNGAEFTIVGVAPSWFTGVHPFLRPALYVPHTMTHEASGGSVDTLTDRAARSADVFARLKPGISIEQSRDDLQRVAAAMAREHPVANQGRGAMVFTQVGYRIAEAPDNFTISWLFFAVAALVLTIACINVANLLLSTAPARRRETAIRLAMGASRTRLLRQFLIESAVLSTAGATAGLVMAAGCAAFIRSIEIASEVPLMFDARVDVRVALFALAVGLVSGVLSGVVPAIRTTRADLNAVLKTSETRLAPARGWMRRALVVVQVAVALVMIVMSGLFLESIQTSRAADPGFRTDHILTLRFDPRMATYELDATRTFYRRLLDRVRALPGVRAAAIGQHVPLGVSSSSTDISIAGFVRAPNQPTLSVGSDVVGDRYFEVLNIPILRGRAFTARDTADAPAVAIVNDAMAKKYWPNREALGATITIQSTPPVTAQVVGVARTSKTADIGETPQPFLYLPIEQSRATGMTVFVLTDGDPAGLAGAVRGEVRALDPNLPIYDLRTLAAHFEQQALWGVRLVAEVVTAVGVIGLALSVLGLYAVVAYSVSQRTREIGIRMAVGASESRVLGMVLQQGLTLSAAGIAAGLALTFVLSSLVGDLLNGVNPRDPRVYVGATLVLLAVTLFATYLPARRASRVDPQLALRAE